MSKTYFTREEFLHSDTAVAKGIQNVANATELQHIDQTIAAITPIRIAWGEYVQKKWPGEKQEIIISSGFRNTQVNSLVGGSATSAHKLGYAADMQPSNGRTKEFQQFVRNWVINAEKSGYRYDQLIIEKNSKGAEWVHFGLYNNSGQQRMMKFDLNPQ